MTGGNAGRDTLRVDVCADRPRPWWPGELAVVAALVVGYDRVANLADLHVRSARERGEALLALERSLRLAVEPALNHAVALHHRLGQVLSLFYDLAHVGVTMGLLAVLYVLRPVGYRAARRALVAVNLAGLAVFGVLPVAPPRLLPGADVVDVVAQSGTWGASSAALAGSGHADAYASMPSLHVAWAVWVVLATCAATRQPVLRRLAGAHLVVTACVVVVTGNHYLLDVAAGALLAGSCWALAAGPTGQPVGASSSSSAVCSRAPADGPPPGTRTRPSSATAPIPCRGDGRAGSADQVPAAGS